MIFHGGLGFPIPPLDPHMVYPVGGYIWYGSRIEIPGGVYIILFTECMCWGGDFYIFGIDPIGGKYGPAHNILALKASSSNKGSSKSVHVTPQRFCCSHTLSMNIDEDSDWPKIRPSPTGYISIEAFMLKAPISDVLVNPVGRGIL